MIRARHERVCATAGPDLADDGEYIDEPNDGSTTTKNLCCR